MTARDLTHCRFALNLKIMERTFDIKDCSGGILHTPGDHGCNFNRTTTLIIYFQNRSIPIVDSQRHPSSTIKWIDPKETTLADSPGITAKKNHYGSLIRLEGKQSFAEKQCHYKQRRSTYQF